MDLDLFKTLCFILHGLRPKALKQSQNLDLFKIKYHLLTMFLINFWEVPNFKLYTWKERFWFTDLKNTKISIFIKMDLGLFKIEGYLDLGLFKIGGFVDLALFKIKDVHYTWTWKVIKKISWKDFVNVNIALNSHRYEKKLEVYTGVQRKVSIVCCSLSPLKGYTDL